jgi:hypothetical protein
MERECEPLLDDDDARDRRGVEAPPPDADAGVGALLLSSNGEGERASSRLLVLGLAVGVRSSCEGAFSAEKLGRLTCE